MGTKKVMKCWSYTKVDRSYMYIMNNQANVGYLCNSVYWKVPKILLPLSPSLFFGLLSLFYLLSILGFFPFSPFCSFPICAVPLDFCHFFQPKACAVGSYSEHLLYKIDLFLGHSLMFCVFLCFSPDPPAWVTCWSASFNKNYCTRKVPQIANGNRR